MNRDWACRLGSIALAIAIANPIFMITSFASGYRLSPSSVEYALHLGFLGGWTGLALAITALIADSSGMPAGVALLLGVFDLAVCRFLYTF